MANRLCWRRAPTRPWEFSARSPKMALRTSFRFEPTAAAAATGHPPSRLVNPEAANPEIAVQRRQFVLNNGICGQRTRMSGHPDVPAIIGINGRTHDPNRIDVETKLGT